MKKPMRISGEELDRVAIIYRMPRLRIRRWWLLGFRTRETDDELRERIRAMWMGR